MSVFELDDLRVGFASGREVTEVVHGVSLAVDAGRTLAVVGESGSGKSVSLLAATRLLPERARVSGSARYAGHELVGLPESRLRAVRGRDIGFVFQEPLTSLHPLKSVGDQVGEAISSHERIGRRVLRDRVVELLEEVGIRDASSRLDEPPARFSGGQRQRIGIAAAIAMRPGLLIADEPTTALDVTVQASILDLLRTLQREHGTAIVLVSHDLAVVSDVADDVVVMREGRVVEQGPLTRVVHDPQHPYTAELLAAAEHRLPVPPPDGVITETPVAELRGVTATFTARTRGRRTSRTVLHGIDIHVRTGEILGLVGESGSGKSTIGRTLFGAVRVDGGEVRVAGEVVNTPGRGRVPLSLAQRARVQTIFQDPLGSLNPRRTIADILAEPLRVHRRRTEQELPGAVAELLDAVRLPRSFSGRYPAQLSGGQRQRVAIARALALDPALLIADEPVSALDVTTQRQIVELLRELRLTRGVSILFISHDLGIVAELCDRVVVLCDGQVVETGRTADVFRDPAQDYTRRLVAAVPGRGLSAVAPVAEVTA
ncbi:ABC transporter ATP-binding protein [Microbacterium sp.]|uniref:ABC transporter ATP-binding protein n=1 Tax=Microbacterium sp. TaxID=51671 RepID=UPI00289A98C6|nr:ABC transporter ATP-binding protein [Microbacterium sp.]